MSLDLKKTLTDTTPLFALVGAADQVKDDVLAAVLDATRRGRELADELAPQAVSARLTDARERAGELPSVALTRLSGTTADVESLYTELADRGVKVVEQLQQTPGAKTLNARTEQLVAQGTAAYGRLRRLAADGQASALAGLYAGRKQAAEQVADVAEQAQEQVTEVTDSVRQQARTAVRSNAAKEGAAKPGAKPAGRKPAAKKQAARKTTAKKATSPKA